MIEEWRVEIFYLTGNENDVEDGACKFFKFILSNLRHHKNCARSKQRDIYQTMHNLIMPEGVPKKIRSTTAMTPFMESSSSIKNMLEMKCKFAQSPRSQQL